MRGFLLIKLRTIMPMIASDSWRLRGKVKEVVKFMFGEGSYRPDNEFLVNAAFALPHPVNLAYRYSHSLG